MVKVETIAFSGVVNENGVKYTEDSLREAVKKFKENKTPLLGVFYPDANSGMVVPLTEVSHQVTNMEVDAKGNLEATIQILDTPRGKQLQGMLEEERELLKKGGSKLFSFGARGMSIESHQEEGVNVVDKFSVSSVNLIPIQSDAFKKYRPKR